MSETMAAFADRTIRSKKIYLYRYEEYNGYNYSHKLSSQTWILERKSSIDLISKNVKNSNFLSILYRKPLR